jgi:hypothetical protein
MMLAPANSSVQLTRCTEFADGPVFTRHLQHLRVSQGRRPVVDPRMAAFPIVEDFDVFEQRRLGFGTGAELRSMNKLGLYRAEE